MARDPQTAVREASGFVAQAITALTEVGPEAPMSVREALSSLGSAFMILGYADPKVEYGIPREPRDD